MIGLPRVSLCQLTIVRQGPCQIQHSFYLSQFIGHLTLKRIHLQERERNLILMISSGSLFAGGQISGSFESPNRLREGERFLRLVATLRFANFTPDPESPEWLDFLFQLIEEAEKAGSLVSQSQLITRGPIGRPLQVLHFQQESKVVFHEAEVEIARMNRPGF